VPALLAERPLRVSREAASVVSSPCEIGTTSPLFNRLPTGFPAAANPARRAVQSCGLPDSPKPRRRRSATPYRRPEAAALSPRAQEERREAVSVPEHGPSIHVTHPPPVGPRRNSDRAVLADSEGPLRIPPPGKRPDAATSPMPPGSRCLRPCKPAGLFAVSSCRRFSDRRPRPPPLTGPQPPFNRLAASREATSEAVPTRSVEMSPLLRSRNPLRRIPGPSQQSPLHRVDRILSPAIPATDCCRNPEDGICRQQTAAPDEQ